MDEVIIIGTANDLGNLVVVYQQGGDILASLKLWILWFGNVSLIKLSSGGSTPPAFVGGVDVDISDVVGCGWFTEVEVADEDEKVEEREERCEEEMIEKNW